MGIPWSQTLTVGKYLLLNKLKGRKKFPLVLMLEPLFQCNLACPGCGKIDYPTETLKRRLSVTDAMAAVNACGAPIVSIPGGEPLIHQAMPALVAALVANKKYVYLCTNALLLEKKLPDYTPSKYLCFSVHLDGPRAMHDQAVQRPGTYDKVIRAMRLALARGFRVNINCTVFNDAKPKTLADFFDAITAMGIEGITLSPGYHYERAPDQIHFLGRQQSKLFFRALFKLQRQAKTKWPLSHSTLFLDFLAGNQSYQCTPWANPTYTIFGWQKPCYLLVNEGHFASFSDLMQATNWQDYGVGRDPKCSNCMAHCGFEGSAILDTLAHPFKAALRYVLGPKLTGPMAPDPLDRAHADAPSTVFPVRIQTDGS